MEAKYTLEYWLDEGWYVGKIKEIPGVFSQGESIEKLEENIIDAYKLVMLENESIEMPEKTLSKELVIRI